MFKNNQFTYGPNAPKHFENHCVTPINSTHSFLAGGAYGVDWGETTEKEAWIYDWENDEWTRVENMRTPAYHDNYCFTVGREVIGKLSCC